MKNKKLKSLRTNTSARNYIWKKEFKTGQVSEK